MRDAPIGHDIGQQTQRTGYSFTSVESEGTGEVNPLPMLPS
jgi:hypothetical protein